MARQLIIDNKEGKRRFALLEEGKLIELQDVDEEKNVSVGDIYIGKVKKLLPGLNSSFIDVGYSKNGFLHYHDLGPNFETSLKFIHSLFGNINAESELSKFEFEKPIPKDGKILELLNPNQKILVQVEKEPISTKGPRLGAEISIAGRFLVLVPFSNRVSISQKISDKEERKRLKEIIRQLKPEGFGMIVRTVAKKKSFEELKSDFDQTFNRWEKCKQKIKQANKFPQKVLGEVNEISSFIRDLFSDEFSKIVCNDAELCKEIKEYIESFASGKSNIVSHYSSNIPIFEKFRIEEQIKLSFGKSVTISKGAYLVIEHTEALHVIDVNSGRRSNSDQSQEENALQINMLAADEIARQLRLRDMGGIIVVDFIDMKLSENKNKLFQHLKSVMATDKTKHKILPPTKFGLVQITRQRVRPQKEIQTREEDPNAVAKEKKIKAPINVIEGIYNQLTNVINRNKKGKIEIHIHPFVAAYLTKGIYSQRLKWYFEFKRKIQIIPRHSYKYLQYKVKAVK